jgi:hypothetical protein
MRQWWNGNDTGKLGLKLIYYIFKELGGKCSTYGGEERSLQGLVEKPEGTRPLERLWRRWEDNIKMDLQEAGRGHGVD